MNKKSGRKATVAKKVASRSHKKSKFSIKSWLLSGLVIMVASAYGFYQYNLQPKGLKVLELSGDIFDYIIPEPATINEICGGSCGLDATGKVVKYQPMAVSMSDKLRDINATIEIEAKKVVKQEKATDNSTEEERVKRVVQEMTTNLQNNTNGITFKDVVKEYDEDGKEKVTKESKEVAAKLEEIAKDSAKVLLKPQTPPSAATQNPGTVNSGSTCPTAAGWGVYSGSSMIGAGDEVYECQSNGTWRGTDCIYKAGNPNKCTVSVLPIYAQEPGKANCYTEGGSIVVGNGSVVENGDGSGLQCRGTKDLEKVTNYNGTWLTDQEIQNIENFKKAEAEKRAKEEADVDAKNAKECPGTYDPTTNICTPKTEKPKVVNPNGTKTGGELTTNSGDCIYGATPTSRGDSRSAEYRCNDSTGKVPQTSEKCQAQGTVVVCKVYDLSGKYLSEYRKSPETVKNEVNPGAKLLGGETTIDDKECLYGATPALDGSGRRLAGKFICNNEKGEKPRVLTALPETFGNNQTLTPAAAQNLTDPNKPWSATNPVAVSNSEDCPPGSSSRTRSGSVESDTKFCYPDPNLSKLPPGAECDVAGVNNNACQSNSCRKMTKPGESEAKFYCLPENTYKSDVRQPDGTLLYKNGTVCRSGSDCASGFCADFAFSWSNIDSQNRCIDNPFVSSTSLLNTQPLAPNSQSVADKKEVNEEVASPGDCESGKAAYIGFQVGGKSFRCKPASFCPEQDLEKMVTCFDNGDPICTSGAPWKPGVDCRMDSSSTNNSNELNAVGTLNDVNNPNAALIGPVLPPGYQIQLQTSSDIRNINLNVNNISTPYDTTVNTSGCAPTTVINAARYLEERGIISPIQMSNYELMDDLINKSGFVIKCTSNGCSSGADAMLKVLEDKFGIEGAFQAYTNNRVMSAQELQNTNGVFLYQGDVTDSTKVIQNETGYFGHNSMFICEDGKCVAIDSYTGGGEPQDCVAIENNMQCGTTTYRLSSESRTVGGPSAAYLLPVPID